MDLLVVHRRIRKRTGKEFILQSDLANERFATEEASQSESRSVLGYSEVRGCLLASLPRPCRLCPLLRALCSAVHVTSMNDDEHVGKGILVYTHFFLKEKQGLHVFCVFLVPVPSLCY